MAEELQTWKKELDEIVEQFLQTVSLNEKSVVVIGCSTSEVAGSRIGTAGTEQVAEMIYHSLQKLISETGASLAFQCCEHLNRAIVIERQAAEFKGWEEVSVVPVRTAGGAMATYAYGSMNDPVVVEHIKADAGIDIGDTFIGMHLKHVAVPIRTTQKNVGAAHVTLATTRPKLIGGVRAVYEKKTENESC